MVILWCVRLIFSNPNEPQEEKLRLSKERNRFKGVVWEQYEKRQRKYLEIGNLCCKFKLWFLFIKEVFVFVFLSRVETENEESFSCTPNGFASAIVAWTTTYRTTWSLARALNTFSRRASWGTIPTRMGQRLLHWCFQTTGCSKRWCYMCGSTVQHTHRFTLNV